MTAKEFIDKLKVILNRSGMYRIHTVEDVYIMFSSEIFFHSNKEVEELSAEFSRFVIDDTNNALENFDWSKIIRLYSGSDRHSLELFIELLDRFLGGSVPNLLFSEK